MLTVPSTWQQVQSLEFAVHQVGGRHGNGNCLRATGERNYEDLGMGSLQRNNIHSSEKGKDRCRATTPEFKAKCENWGRSPGM